MPQIAVDGGLPMRHADQRQFVVPGAVGHLRRVIAQIGPLNLLYAALCVLSLLPFVLIAQPPIVDFANHAARLSLACNLGDPAVSSMYRYELGWIPNLAVDVVNVPLCGLVSPTGVLKLVTAGSLALIYFSGWLIQRKLFGRSNAFLLLLPAIAFNLVTTMGYINFLAGVAVACLMVALSIGREKRFGELMLICNVGGVVLFFCHIFALAFAMVFFFGLMLSCSPKTPRGLVAAALKTTALFALPLLMVPLVPSGGQAFKINYAAKYRMVPALFLAPHPNPGLFGFLFAVPFYFLLRNRLAEVHVWMRLPLLVCAAYVLLIPGGIQDAIDVDSRTLVPVAYLFFASLRPVQRENDISAAVTGASSVLLGFGLIFTLLVWRPFSREVDEFRASLNALPRQASVLSVMSERGEARAVEPLAYSHLASYATLDRRVFNPLEFTGVGMQPLSSTPKFAALDTPASMPITPDLAVILENPSQAFVKRALSANGKFMIGWPKRFDYVIYYHFGDAPNFDTVHLTEVRRGSFFSILKVRKPARV